MEIEKLKMNETVQLFKDAAEALLPYIAKCGLDYLSEDDAEELDELFAELFNTLVFTAMKRNISEIDFDLINLPKYGFYYKNYKGSAFISVNSSSVKTEGTLVLVQITSKKALFDTVYCNEIGEDGLVVNDGIEVPYTDCEFDLSIS